MTTCTTDKKIPKYPNTSSTICDKAGNILQYDVLTNTWVFKGRIEVPNLVTEHNDGIIDTTIYDKLQKLRTIYESGQYKFTPLKIKPGIEGYWYYFKSSDKLFRFIPEAEDVLRIEVDKARIYQIAMKQLCPGIKGQTGDIGPKGVSGFSGAAELCYAPTLIANNQMTFAIYTPTPLDTRISLRLYPVSRSTSAQAVQLKNQVFELLPYFKKYDQYGQYLKDIQQMKTNIVANSMGIKPQAETEPLSEVLTGSFTTGSEYFEFNIDPKNPTTNSTLVSSNTITININETISSFRYENNILYGTIVIEGLWSSYGTEWCLRSRQRGPKGPKGDPGLCRLNAVTTVLDNTNFLPNCPIVNLRHDNVKNTLYWKCNSLANDICTSSIVLVNDAATLNDRTVMDSEFVSAQMTLNGCKHLQRHKPSIPSYSIPELQFVNWEPQADCVLKRHFDKYSFDWQSKLATSACNPDVKWYSATDLRAPTYPYPQLPTEPSTDTCCEDTFFYCPNVQDAPCIDNVIANAVTAMADSQTTQSATQSQIQTSLSSIDSAIQSDSSNLLALE